MVLDLGFRPVLDFGFFFYSSFFLSQAIQKAISLQEQHRRPERPNGTSSSSTRLPGKQSQPTYKASQLPSYKSDTAKSTGHKGRTQTSPHNPQ